MRETLDRYDDGARPRHARARSPRAEGLIDNTFTRMVGGASVACGLTGIAN